MAGSCWLSGGDCSIVLGCLLGAGRQVGRIGLAYVDAHADQMMTKNKDMNIAAPTPLPASLKQAVTLWLVAIGAGVFETLLVVANVLWGDGNLANGESLNAGVAVRLVIFVAMTLVALQLRLGKNWARWTIGILLGVFGLLSLVIQPLSWLMEGHAVSEAFAHLNLASAAFMLSRAVHMLAVVAATALMFVPTSNTFFRAQKGSGQ